MAEEPEQPAGGGGGVVCGGGKNLNKHSQIRVTQKASLSDSQWPLFENIH